MEVGLKSRLKDSQDICSLVYNYKGFSIIQLELVDAHCESILDLSPTPSVSNASIVTTQDLNPNSRKTTCLLMWKDNTFTMRIRASFFAFSWHPSCFCLCAYIYIISSFSVWAYVYLRPFYRAVVTCASARSISGWIVIGKCSSTVRELFSWSGQQVEQRSR